MSWLLAFLSQVSHSGLSNRKLPLLLKKKEHLKLLLSGKDQWFIVLEDIMFYVKRKYIFLDLLKHKIYRVLKLFFFFSGAIKYCILQMRLAHTELWGTHWWIPTHIMFQGGGWVCMYVCAYTHMHARLISEQAMSGRKNRFCSLKLAPAAAISTHFHNTYKYIHTLLGEKLLAFWFLLLISNQK